MKLAHEMPYCASEFKAEKLLVSISCARFVALVSPCFLWIWSANPVRLRRFWCDWWNFYLTIDRLFDSIIARF
jgi:hypothetical protein